VTRRAPTGPSRSLDGLGAVFDHVAVAARQIRDLLPTYQDLLGGRFLEGGDNPRVGYRALHLGFPDGGRIELMEPLPGSMFFDRFFRRAGGGLHHVTFKVKDLRAAVERLNDRGNSLTGLYLEDPTWREVFLHPKENHGVLLQLAEDNRPPRPPTTIDDVLGGRGSYGTGTPSP